MHGWIRFYAPKGTGRFVFRIYCGSQIVATLATSNFFSVEISFHDVVPTLKFLVSQMKDKRTTMTALQQMPMVISSIPYPQKAGGPWGNLLWDAIRWAQKQAANAEAEAEAAALKSRMTPEELGEKLRVQIEKRLFIFARNAWPSSLPFLAVPPSKARARGLRCRSSTTSATRTGRTTSIRPCLSLTFRCLSLPFLDLRLPFPAFP